MDSVVRVVPQHRVPVQYQNILFNLMKYLLGMCYLTLTLFYGLLFQLNWRLLSKSEISSEISKTHWDLVVPNKDHSFMLSFIFLL